MYRVRAGNGCILDELCCVKGAFQLEKGQWLPCVSLLHCHQEASEALLAGSWGPDHSEGGPISGNISARLPALFHSPLGKLPPTLLWVCQTLHASLLGWLAPWGAPEGTCHMSSTWLALPPCRTGFSLLLQASCIE